MIGKKKPANMLAGEASQVKPITEEMPRENAIRGEDLNNDENIHIIYIFCNIQWKLMSTALKQMVD